MVTRGHSGCGHEGDGQANGLTLGGANDDLLIDFNAILVAQDTGQCNLGTIANGVDLEKD